MTAKAVAPPARLAWLVWGLGAALYLIAFYQRERKDDESAPVFFQRVPLEDVTRELLDLQRLTEADAVPEDFVDLAETGEYTPEVMDGECSA